MTPPVDERSAGQPGDGPGADELARAGLDHLQAAAREAIQAARTLLDVAERVVEDPAAVQAAMGSFASVAHAALQRLRAMDPDGPSDGGAGEPPDDGRIHRIKVS